MTTKTREKSRLEIAIYGILTLLLLLALVIPGLAAGDSNPVIASFELENPVSTQTVPVGTRLEDLELPTTLKAEIQQVEETSPEEIPVSWNDNGLYDENTPGLYILTSEFIGYTYEKARPFALITVDADAETVFGENTKTDSGKEILHIKEFIIEPIKVEVSRGIGVTDIPLPEELPAKDQDGNVVRIPVTWENIYTEENNEEECYEQGSRYDYGPWEFTSKFGEGYTYEGSMPTAQISIPDSTEIVSFCGNTSDGLLVRIPVLAVESAEITLPQQVGAIMADGGYKNIAVSWNGNYNAHEVGVYRYEMKITDNNRYDGVLPYGEIAVK